MVCETNQTLTAALLCPSGYMDMIAWALSAFSGVKVKGVSALFSGVSLCNTKVSPPHLAELVLRAREAFLARPEKRVLTNIIYL